MFKRIGGAALALFALALVSRGAEAKTLHVGDMAPSLTVKKFVKGEPVSKFEKGKLYVVEFWATWCGPCKVSIPHLTEMQKKFKSVNFIGVSVFEHNPSLVEPFVASMGSKMDYRVAMDSVPEGKQGSEGEMASSWMVAAEQPGIPTAFIVDKGSRIAWVGHPMALEESLSKVVAGKWDISKATADEARADAAQAAQNELDAELKPLRAAHDMSGALTVIDAAILAKPELEAANAEMKFNLLIGLGKDAEARTYGDKLIDGTFHENVMGLNSLAWEIVNPENPKKAAPPLVDLAVKAAKRADVLSKGKDSAIADTLATAYFAAGKKELAISTEERALANTKDPTLTADLQKSLDRFKK